MMTRDQLKDASAGAVESATLSFGNAAAALSPFLPEKSCERWRSGATKLGALKRVCVVLPRWFLGGMQP